MSHARHIERVNEDCATCHKSLPEPFAGAAATVKMGDCLSCHPHGKEYAVTQFTYALGPVSDFSHQGNYIEHHAGDARSSAEQCAQCHDQTFCSDCHARAVATRIEARFPERVAAQFIHSNDFLARHSIEQAADSASCQRCHGRSFCDSCQQVGGIGGNPHPASWLGRHDEKEIADNGMCRVCHQ